MKKAVLCVLLSILLLLPLCLTAAGAGEVYFTIVGDIIMDLLPSTMPVVISGKMYAPHTIFDVKSRGTGALVLGISYFHQPDYGTLTLAGHGKVLQFDLILHSAQSGETHYNYRVYQRNGLLFLPIKDIAAFFGFKYTIFGENPAPILRVATSSSLFTDREFLDAAYRPSFTTRYDAYQAMLAGPSPPPGTSVSPPPSSPETRKTAYLTFEGGPTEHTPDILSLLGDYGMKAAFFLSSDEILSGDAVVRRIYGEGHTLGLLLPYSPGMTDSELTTSLALANDRLSRILNIRARLIRFSPGSRTVPPELRDAAVAAGCRFWDFDIDADPAAASSAQNLASRAITRLRARSQAVVLRLKQDDVSLAALPAILNYLTAENYTIRQITQSDPPINEVRDLR